MRQKEGGCDTKKYSLGNMEVFLPQSESYLFTTDQNILSTRSRQLKGFNSLEG